MEKNFPDDMPDLEATLPPGFYLPFGAKLSDVFIPARRIMQELEISKNTLIKWREANELDFTESPTGSLYYFKQEIAKILFEKKTEKLKN